MMYKTAIPYYQREAQRLRRDGEQAISKGQALLKRAEHIETCLALGEDPEESRAATQPVFGSLVDTIRAMAEKEWVTARMIADAVGRKERSAASTLSRMVHEGLLNRRKHKGFPTEYRSVDCDD